MKPYSAFKSLKNLDELQTTLRCDGVPIRPNERILWGHADKGLERTLALVMVRWVVGMYEGQGTGLQYWKIFSIKQKPLDPKIFDQNNGGTFKLFTRFMLCV